MVRCPFGPQTTHIPCSFSIRDKAGNTRTHYGLAMIEWSPFLHAHRDTFISNTQKHTRSSLIVLSYSYCIVFPSNLPSILRKKDSWIPSTFHLVPPTVYLLPSCIRRLTLGFGGFACLSHSHSHSHPLLPR